MDNMRRLTVTKNTAHRFYVKHGENPGRNGRLKIDQCRMYEWIGAYEQFDNAEIKNVYYKDGVDLCDIVEDLKANECTPYFTDEGIVFMYNDGVNITSRTVNTEAGAIINETTGTIEEARSAFRRAKASLSKAA